MTAPAWLIVAAAILTVINALLTIIIWRADRARRELIALLERIGSALEGLERR